MGAMRRRERVVDPDIAELGEFGNERRIVLLFLFVEAGVFQAEDVAILIAAIALAAGSPMQSSANATGFPITFDNASATGFSESWHRGPSACRNVRAG